jgi:diadenosine tetraphosphate (Ap4A) HIT family hydrolase
MDPSECPICLKHRGVGNLVGPVIYDDDLVSASHRPVGPAGYVFIETRRHVAYVDELTDDEAAAIGRVRSRLARGLRAELDVEFVHAQVSGRGVPHFHEHVFVRHTGTPSDYEWWRQWPDAPPGDLDDLARRLSGYLD